MVHRPGKVSGTDSHQTAVAVERGGSLVVPQWHDNGSQRRGLGVAPVAPTRSMGHEDYTAIKEGGQNGADGVSHRGGDLVVVRRCCGGTPEVEGQGDRLR
jgi:hypothetical protein